MYASSKQPAVPFKAVVTKVRCNTLNKDGNTRFVSLLVESKGSALVLVARNVPVRIPIPRNGQAVLVTKGSRVCDKEWGWQTENAVWKIIHPADPYEAERKELYGSTLSRAEKKDLFTKGLSGMIFQHFAKDHRDLGFTSVKNYVTKHGLNVFLPEKRNHLPIKEKMIMEFVTKLRHAFDEEIIRMAAYMHSCSLKYSFPQRTEGKNAPDSDDDGIPTLTTSRVRSLQEKPFLLVFEYRMNFDKVQKLASALTDRTDPETYAVAAAVAVLNENEDNGHTYMSLESFKQAFRDKTCVSTKRLVSRSFRKWVGLEEANVFLASTNRKEVMLSKSLRGKITSPCRRFDETQAKDCFLATSPQWQDEPLQFEAVRKAITSQISVISGGPGTGKSTVILAIIEYFLREGMCVHACAPTGKAAQRLARKRKSRTIHSLLNCPRWVTTPPSSSKKPTRSEACDDSQEHCMNKCELNGQMWFSTQRQHVVIIDEFSMVDLDLAYRLFKSFPPDTVFVIVGDVHQLPSIGCGDVLRDILTSPQVPRTYLQNIYRQQGNASSGIPELSKQIREGTVDLKSLPGCAFHSVEHFTNRSPEKHIRDFILFLFKQEYQLNKNDWARTQERMQILIPMKKGTVGVHEINRMMQNLNPNAKNKENAIFTGTKVLKPPAQSAAAGPKLEKDTYENLTLYPGDKVLMTANDHTRGVYNGTTGIILSLSKAKVKEEERTLIKVRWFDMPGKNIIDYDYEDKFLTHHTTLGYVITVHKSQGSEVPKVVLVSSKQYGKKLQTKPLIYTGTSRPKEQLHVIYDSRATFLEAVKRESEPRQTLLPKYLSRLLEQEQEDDHDGYYSDFSE